MAHCKEQDLEDLDELLSKIRMLDKLKERKKGIFYLKSKGFLHFHTDKSGRRWADVRDGADWGEEIDLPFNPETSLQSAFFDEVVRRYERCLKK